MVVKYKLRVSPKAILLKMVESEGIEPSWDGLKSPQARQR
jgi:hypothetical protein